MVAKAHLYGEIALASPEPKRTRWPRLAIMSLGLLYLVHLFLQHSANSAGPAGATEALTYPGESIEWKSCGNINDHDLECAEIDVPMDQFDLTRSSNKTFLIPLLRLRGKNATQNLIVNPGGPGGSGINFIYRKGALLNRIVGEEFHILSFDPRGINSSLPRASCYPTSESREKLSLGLDRDVIRDSGKRYAWTQNYVRACQENMGEHGKYINTPQTAADMNSILDAVGQKDMVYWGFSYGTLLGQTYASLFPDRSHRVIIDGVVDQIQWYDDLILEDDFIDTQHVLDGFFDECVKSGDKCALSGLAKSKEELQHKVVTFLRGLEKEPLPVFINTTTYGTLDYTTLWNAVFGHMYKPATWFDLATRLQGLMLGNTTDAFLEYGVEDFSSQTDDAIDVVTNNDGRSGSKYWPKSRTELLDILAPLYNQSSFAFSENQAYYARQQWLIPKTHNFKPSSHVVTAHPLLILSTTYDPICPLKSAKKAEAVHAGSRLVEVKGYGHCSVAVASACLAQHVHDFLHTGKLPPKGATCEVDEPYFQEPESQEALWARLSAVDSEDATRAAQSLLALQGIDKRGF
ncbi:Alpha/Beta hydrolase protein [Thelonectria olida]|uniref:Alpha/Beta hydrolase protein n=1 Tax=Thelonectria olida TaxID=1576542 RepID=A0A9P8VRX4_9HYPO|nr:Alpha/Beta hydrolase protein [Thelonectria olida]